MVARLSEEPLEHLDSDSIRRQPFRYLDGPWDFADSWLVTGGLSNPLHPNEIIHLLASFR